MLENLEKCLENQRNKNKTKTSQLLTLGKAKGGTTVHLVGWVVNNIYMVVI